MSNLGPSFFLYIKTKQYCNLNFQNVWKSILYVCWHFRTLSAIREMRGNKGRQRMLWVMVSVLNLLFSLHICLGNTDSLFSVLSQFVKYSRNTKKSFVLKTLKTSHYKKNQVTDCGVIIVEKEYSMYCFNWIKPFWIITLSGVLINSVVHNICLHIFFPFVQCNKPNTHQPLAALSSEAAHYSASDDC